MEFAGKDWAMNLWECRPLGEIFGFYELFNGHLEDEAYCVRYRVRAFPDGRAPICGAPDCGICRELIH